MTDGAPAPDARAFRTLMGRWATGVSVVTASDHGRDAGLTVNAFLSVSLAPPSVLVSLSQDVDTLPVIERTGAFAVNVLAAGQREVSERFARPVPAPEKFEGIAVDRGPGGLPLVRGALGTLECRLLSSTPVFDHRLLVGEVVRLTIGAEELPLVFFRAGYAVAEDRERLRLPTAPASR